MLKRSLSVFLAFALLFSAACAFTGCKKTEVHTNSEQYIEQPPESEPTTVYVPETTTEPEVQPIATDRNPFTGLPGYEQDYNGQKHIGIVVENTPDARPQWGMSTPDIIMEYEVEGGITRMLWLYANPSRIPSRVGPIRSVRHDVAEIVYGYDLLLIHCGGSSQAYSFIKNTPSFKKIDGMSYDKCFVRDQTRNVASEHRLCLLGEKVPNAIYNYKFDMTIDPAKTQPFLFKEPGEPCTTAGGVCKDIKLSFSSNYNYEFAYDEASLLYKCDINGRQRVDDSGIQCAFTNVIILYTDMVSLQTEKGHQDLLLENGGRGLYLSGGTCEEITWSKPTPYDMLKMYGSDGTELKLNCGRSYIGLVRSTQSGKTVLS